MVVHRCQAELCRPMSVYNSCLLSPGSGQKNRLNNQKCQLLFFMIRLLGSSVAFAPAAEEKEVITCKEVCSEGKRLSKNGNCPVQLSVLLLFFFLLIFDVFTLLLVKGELCSCSLFCSSQLCNKSLFDLCRALHWWLFGGSIPHIPLSAYPGSYANHQCGNTNPGKFREILSF